MNDQLGPDFDERLGAELDRVSAPTPLPANARFNASPPGYRPLVGRKVVLAVAGAVALLMVAATALARSPNPAVWVSTVESVTHVGESSPSPSPESAPQAQPQPPAHAEPTSPAEPSHESPEPSGDTEGGDSGSRSPSPSPSPSGSEH
jgi:hypothetical protein